LGDVSTSPGLRLNGATDETLLEWTIPMPLKAGN